jgi:hypothetical protein
VLTYRAGGEDVIQCPVVLRPRRLPGGMSLTVAESLPFGGLGGLVPAHASEDVARIGAVRRFAEAFHGFALRTPLWYATRIKTFLSWQEWRRLGGPESAPWLKQNPLAALRLPASPEELIGRYSAHHRRHLVQAQRSHAEVRTSASEEELRSFYRLVDETLERAGAIADLSEPFFLACGRELIDRGCGTLYTVYAGGQLVAGIFIVHDHRRSFYWLGGMRRGGEAVAIRPMFLLFDTAFRDAIAAGRAEFELGGTPNEGLSRFKLGWGAKLSSYVYLDVINSALRSVHALFARTRWNRRSTDTHASGPMGW